MNPDKQSLLQKELALLKEASTTLARSYQKCQTIGAKTHYTLEELDHFEGLTSRFARLSDILIQKIFRLIEEMDLDPPATVRDRVHRAEKKGIIASSNIFIEIRELRNDIAHEYLPVELSNIYKKVMEWTPILLDTVHRVETYCRKYTAGW